MEKLAIGSLVFHSLRKLRDVFTKKDKLKPIQHAFVFFPTNSSEAPDFCFKARTKKPYNKGVLFGIIIN